MDDAIPFQVDWVWVVAPILVVLGFHLIGSIAVFFTRVPRQASSPEPLDLATLPGINHTFLETWSVKLKELGFRHLMDYELPHARNKQTRLISSSYSSPNGSVLGTLSQRFSTQFAHDYYSFTTWFTSGHRLITTTNPMPVVDLTPFLHFQRFPDSKDMAAVLKSHEAALASRPASWGEPELVSRVDDIGRVNSAGWAKEIEHLCEKGIFRIEGESIRPTVYGAGTFFWKGIRPFPANYAAKVQLARIGIPSLLALGLAFLISKLAPGSETLLLWAMGAVGAAYGLGLWYHGYFWCLAVPSCAVFLATQRTDLAARSAVYAAIGLVGGFMVSAARSQSRGRKLMGHQSTPGPKPERTLHRWIIAVVVAAGILTALYNARSRTFVMSRDRAAEAALKRIEQTLASAKTLRVRFERKVVGRNAGPLFEGTLLVKEGNRMSLSLKPAGAGGQADSQETLQVSNGNGLGLFLRTKDGWRQVTYPAAIKPAELNATIAMLLSRNTGAIGLQAFLTAPDELRRTYEVTSLKTTTTNGATLLTYDVGIHSATVKCDPRTGLPKERVLTDRYVIVGKSTVIETFQEWELDVEIPDDAFEFPKTK